MTLSGQTYRCSAGETFDSIALSVYGDEIYAVELLNANPSLCCQAVFTGGEILRLPTVKTPESSNDSPYMPEKAPWKE